MRTNILRSVAWTLGICVCGAAHAQYGGYPMGPAYNNGYQPQPTSNSGYNSVPVHPSLRALPPAPTSQVAPQPIGISYAQTPSYQAQPGFAGAQPQYVAPAPQYAQPQFPNAQPYRAVSSGMEGVPVGSYPQPAPMPAPQPMMHEYAPAPVAAPAGNCSSCNTGNIYYEAAAAPWSGSAPIESCGPAPVFSTVGPIRNWFAGSSILFMDMEDDCNQRLVFPDAMPQNTMLETNMVSPGSTTGFETYFGRYFGCGKYAVSLGYFYLNPDLEEAVVMPPATGDYRAAMPLWDRMYIDRDQNGIADDVGAVGPGDDHIYGVFDNATDYRIRRNVEFQGLELNFTSFGIGGASRAGCLSGCAPCNPCGSCAPAGCGGMCGNMIPSCNSRTQFSFSHGLRWLRFKDQFEFAASATDMVFGSGTDDYYYNVNTENDLIGYQLGARINYCLTKRVSLYAGGKFGLYGNNVDYYSRIGTRDVAAQVNAAYPSYQNMPVVVSRSDTVLSSLGELDLGVGVRLANCWTLTGGYRLMGITGVATSVGNISNDPAHLVDGHLTCLNDSILLHGGYVGVQYNW